MPTDRSGTDRSRDLDHVMRPLSVADRLSRLASAVDGRIVFTTSFGLEDQVLTHFVATSGLAIDVVTLDTGRLFPEVYMLWSETEERYGLSIAPCYPAAAAAEGFVRQHGINGFYASREARKACCGVRKVEPLGRALAGARAWLTGLRADQSANRASAAIAEFDADRDLVKVNPLLDWSRDDALGFARQHRVPVNPLHERGFVSIGCAPCTRAIRPGEPERAGRWWWEDDDKKECGLHVGADGRLVRGPVPALTDATT